MTLAELKTILESAFQGKVCYNAWAEKEAPQLPWVCFYQTGTNNESADNKVHFSAIDVTVELYTETKDVNAETTLETSLTNACIFYEKTCEYLNTEKLYMTTYTLEV